MSCVQKWMYRSLAALLLLGVALYAAMTVWLAGRPPVVQLNCIESGRRLAAWTCDQLLSRRGLSAAQVRELNNEAGASLPLLLRDDALAERMLAIFIKQGVLVNARDDRARGWTALHGEAFNGRLERVRMLLVHGADPSIADSTGKTPLDIAKRMQATHPDEPARAEVVKALGG